MSADTFNDAPAPAPADPMLTASEWIARATRLGIPPKVLYFRDEWMLSLPIDSELPMPDRAMRVEIFALLFARITPS